MNRMRLTFLDPIPPRWRRWGIGLAAAFVLYSLAGFLLLPALVKWQLLKQLPALTQREAAVRQVRFNPWTLALTVRGLALAEPDGRRFAAWEEFHVNFQASSLFRRAWTFREIRLVQPFLEVVLLPDGRLNLATLVPPPDPGAPPPSAAAPSSIPRVGIEHLIITNGFVAFDDRTLRHAFRTEYQPINLHLTRFTTRPDADSPYSFHAEGDRESRLRWAGNLTVQPLRSQGELELVGMNLARYQAYLDRYTHAHLTNGFLDFQVAYRFEFGTNGLDLVTSNTAVRVREFRLVDPRSDESVVLLPLAEITDAGLNLRERTLRVEALQLTGLSVPGRREADGEFHLLGLFGPALGGASVEASAAPPSAPAPPPAGVDSPPWTISLGEFALDRAQLAFSDLSLRTPFRTTLEPVTFRLRDFSTVRDHEAAFSFSLTSESGDQVSLSGAACLDPPRSSGELRVVLPQVGKYLPYAEDAFRGRLPSGRLELTVPYRLALDGGRLEAGITNTALRLSDLEVRVPDDDAPLARVGAFTLEGLDARFPEQLARLALVRSSNSTFRVRRDADGSLNWLALLPPDSAAEPAAATPPAREEPISPAGAPWDVAVDRVQLEDYAVEFEDQQPAEPAEFQLNQVSLDVQGFRTTGNPPLATRLSLRVNDTGSLTLGGTAHLEPLALALDLGLTNLDLPSFQPYLEPHARLELTSGVLATSGHLRWGTEAADPAQLAFAGNVHLDRLSATDQVNAEKLVGWENLALTGIELGLQPDHLKLASVIWRGLEFNLVRAADGQLNLASVLAAPASEAATGNAAAAEAASAPPSSTERFPVQLDRFELDNAVVRFTDRAIEPVARVGLHQLSGTVKGLSSALNTTAEVDLAGQVDEQAPLAIKGRVNPLAAEPFLDLEITNRNTQLAAFTPYTEKYLGHPLNRGRLTMGLHYQLQGVQLEAANRFEIEQLMLGARNDSPDATSLPVKLGVALLKDRQGRIELDVPITGRLDDPQFRIGGAILKVIANLIVKTALSPFSLLGKLVGGGEELSFVEFVPGTAELVDGELPKIEKLVAALAERPALNLEIEGSADPVRDRDALALAGLRARLEAQHRQSHASRRRAAAGAEPPPLEPEEYERLLRAAFVERFGTNLTEVLSGEVTSGADVPSGDTAAAVAPKPKPKRGFLGLFGRRHPAASAAEKRLDKAERAALDELTPGRMEILLARQMEIPEDALRELMSARARWVQDHLLASGTITADRLFLAAPRPATDPAGGECRVRLALN